MRWRRFSGKRYLGWVDPELEVPARLLEYPEQVTEWPGQQHLLDCQGRQIFRLPFPYRGRPQSCFTYLFSNHSWGRSMRPSYAFRSLRMSRRLQRAGIGTLEVVAALKKRGEWLNWNSFLIALEIPSVYEIPSSGPHVFQIHPLLDNPQAVLSALARELASFHRKRFFHGDLKARHILVRNPESPHRRFFFVDLEKTAHLPHTPAWIRDILAARDLVQLFASLSPSVKGGDGIDLRREFLHQYLEASQISPRRRKRLTRLLGLYGPGGLLRQGETLLDALRRGSTRGSGAPRDSRGRT